MRGRGRPAHPDLLTPVEWAVLRHVRDGLSNSEIAQLRGCRTDTIKYHIANIVSKLEVPDRDALRRWRDPPASGEQPDGIDLRAWERRRSMPPTVKAKAKLTGVAPFFLVDDVTKTAEWYRDVLGFTIGEYLREEHGAHEHDEHGNHVGSFKHEQDSLVNRFRDHGTRRIPAHAVQDRREGTRCPLQQRLSRGLRQPGETYVSYDAYFWVDDVEPLFEHANSAGARVIEKPTTRFYGLREFILKDYDGRVLSFGSPSEPV